MNISTSTILQERRRPHQTAQREEEDAAKLYFGPEFDVRQTSHEGTEAPLIALNLSETRLLINAALQQRRRDNEGESSGDMNDEDEEDFSNSNEILRKTQEYLSVFARFKDEQTVSAAEHLLKSQENADLHPFEIAQLGSLVCEDAEEAKTLIPSLAYKKNDEELQVLLDNLRRFG